MNIVVFIKQVPDTDDVQWTADNNIDRAKTDTVINPVDRQALEAALRIKDQFNAHACAITMGIKKSKEILKEAIAAGIDDAVLLCDSKFAGSDTCATSKVLASVIKEKYPDTDIILFGQSAADGETAQTGPSTAVRLNLPFISHVNEIINIENNTITLTAETETSKSTYTVTLPAVICIDNYIFPPRLPRIRGYINADSYNYKCFNLYDLKLKENETGIKGSPTYVSKVYRTNEKRNCNIIEAKENGGYYADIISQIKEAAEK